MRLKTLWIARTHADTPELVCAVDEYSDDENPDWFVEECGKQLAAVGSDLSRHAIINLDVREKDIWAILAPSGDVEAKVV